MRTGEDAGMDDEKERDEAETADELERERQRIDFRKAETWRVVKRDRKV